MQANGKTSQVRKVKMAAALAAVFLAAAPVHGQQVVAKLDGTSKSTFKVGATSAAPLSLQNVSGRLTLGGGLRVTAGTVDFTGATISGFSLTSGSLTGVTIDNSVIGGVTPAAGSFTTLNSTGGALNGTIGATTPAAGTFTAISGPLNGTVGQTTPAAGSFTTLNSTGGALNGSIGGTTPAAGTFTTLTSTGGSINGAIGNSNPAVGTFTTINSSGQYTNTVSTGTAPLVVSSTTRVTNLNADRVDSLDFSTVSQAGGVLYLSSAGVVATKNHLLPATGLKLWSIDSSGVVNYEFPGTAGNIWISSGTGVVAQTVGGDATLASDGTLTLSANSVGSTEIIDGSVAAADLASDAVTTAKILNSNVTTAKLADSNVTAAKLADAVADVVPTATASVGAEAGNTIRVSLQVKDAQGNALAGYHLVPWSITDGASGALPNSSVPLTTNTATGTDWHVITAEYRKFAVTNSAGLLELDVICGTDSTVNAHFWVGALHYTVALDFN